MSSTPVTPDFLTQAKAAYIATKAAHHAAKAVYKTLKAAADAKDKAELTTRLAAVATATAKRHDVHSGGGIVGFAFGSNIF